MDNWFWVGIIQVVFLSLLLLSKKGKKQADYILLALLITIGVHLGYYQLALQHYWRNRWIPGVIGHALAMCYGPLLYLYILSLIRSRRVQALTFFLHLLPYGLYVGAWIVFEACFPTWNIYIYLGLMSMSNAHTPWYVQMSSYLMAISAAGYALYNLKVLRAHQQNISDTFSSHEKIDLNWLRYAALSFFLIFICIFLILNLWPSGDTSPFVKVSGISIVMLLWVFALGYFGFRQTHIFSNIGLEKPASESNSEKSPEDLTKEQPPQKKQKETQKRTTEAEPTRYQKSGLKAETSQQYAQAAQQLIQEKKLYLDSDLTLHQLAAELDVPAYHLSQALNEQLQLNFFDFVNQYRVEEVKLKIADAQYQHYTLLAIAFESGFRSKASFNRIFKRFAGMTPSEYKKSMDS